MKAHIASVFPRRRHVFFSSFASELNAAQSGDLLVRAAFAYATLGGVQAFIAHADSVRQWAGVQKRFLIGIHHAITEPSALQTLCGIPNAEVRAFVAGDRIRPEALDATPVFHPKVIAISNVDGRKVRLLQAGSANMTAAAIGVKPQNYEFAIGIVAEDGLAVDHERHFYRWWSHVWSRSQIVDEPFVDRYAALRERVLEKNPILRSTVEVPPSIAKAKNFFAEVGAASGPPGQRHQIEFPEALAMFFGPVSRGRRDITLRRGAHVWPDRPLSYKRTTYGVEIWRLGMPTQHSGGDAIAHRAIRFVRTEQRDAFEFEVADVGSKEFNRWIRLANRRGHLGTTRGQGARQCGFY